MGNRHKKALLFSPLLCLKSQSNSIKLPLDNEYVIVKKGEETLYILFV